MADKDKLDTPEGVIPAVRAFNKELAPSFIDHVCITSGFAPPPGSPLGEGMGAGFAYCELHCGSAVSATMLASSNPLGDFHVIDARADMIEAGRSLANDGKVRNITFYESGVEAVLEKSFPAFDYIAVNGIYTWVPLRDRALVLSFARKFLKPGGAIFLSYNARPGWNKLDAFRRIFREALRGRTGIDTREGLSIAREIYTQLHAAKAPPVLNSAPPAALSFLDDVPPEALIADYANDFADPLYVTDVAADFAAIDCVLAGSSEMSESLGVLIGYEPFKSILERMPTQVGRELAKDYLQDTMLRRDVFVRGGKRLAADNSDMIIQGLAFALEQPPGNVRYQVRLPFAEVKIDNLQARTLVDLLAESPRTLGELVEKARAEGEDPQGVIANIHALLLTNQIRPVYRATREAAANARNLRDAIRSRAATPQAIGFLPSPFGTAFAVPIADQLFMDMPNVKGAEDLAKKAATELQSTGRSREALSRRARTFLDIKGHYLALGLSGT